VSKQHIRWILYKKALTYGLKPRRGGYSAEYLANFIPDYTLPPREPTRWEIYKEAVRAGAIPRRGGYTVKYLKQIIFDWQEREKEEDEWSEEPEYIDEYEVEDIEEDYLEPESFDDHEIAVMYLDEFIEWVDIIESTNDKKEAIRWRQAIKTCTTSLVWKFDKKMAWIKKILIGMETKKKSRGEKYRDNHIIRGAQNIKKTLYPTTKIRRATSRKQKAKKLNKFFT
jgi:hypothetical protein